MVMLSSQMDGWLVCAVITEMVRISQPLQIHCALLLSFERGFGVWGLFLFSNF